MLTKQIEKILKGYDLENITIGCIASHSALDVCDGAKDEGLPNLAVCERGREAPYTQYFKRRHGKTARAKTGLKGVVDTPLVLPKFSDVMNDRVQELLRERNVLWVPNRSFVVYADEDPDEAIRRIEEDFRVPIVGSRDMLKIENRETVKENYYWLCEQAGIPTPEKISDPKGIDKVGLVMVKLPHAKYPLERGFFTAASYDEYMKKAEQMEKEGNITFKELRENARIEKYIMGQVFNFNFFYSPLEYGNRSGYGEIIHWDNKTGELKNGVYVSNGIELLSIDTRYESDLDGLVRVPAEQQATLPQHQKTPVMIIVGHQDATLRESLLRKVFPLAEAFVDFSKKHYQKGMIGPFCIQTMVDKEMNFWVYDIATRIGGGTNIHMNRGHAYANSIFDERMSAARRLCREIKVARYREELSKLVT